LSTPSEQTQRQQLRASVPERFEEQSHCPRHCSVYVVYVLASVDRRGQCDFLAIFTISSEILTLDSHSLHRAYHAASRHVHDAECPISESIARRPEGPSHSSRGQRPIRIKLNLPCLYPSQNVLTALRLYSNQL